MPKIKLTHRGIEALKAGKWLTDFWDETLTGFGVRVHQNGRKTYILRYSTDSSRRRMTLGTYPALSLVDARSKAKELIGRIARGKDPQAEKHAGRKAETFGELAAEYLERYAKPQKRRWKEDARILKANLLPAWKRRKAKSITRRDVADLLDGIVGRGSPIMANRTKALLSKIYNFGMSRDIVEYNPCHGVPMPAHSLDSKKQRCRRASHPLDGLMINNSRANDSLDGLKANNSRANDSLDGLEQNYRRASAFPDRAGCHLYVSHTSPEEAILGP